MPSRSQRPARRPVRAAGAVACALAVVALGAGAARASAGGAAASLAQDSPLWAMRGPRSALHQRRTVPARAPDGVRFLAIELRTGEAPERVLLTNAVTVGELLTVLGVDARRVAVSPAPGSTLHQREVVRVLGAPPAVGELRGAVVGVAAWYSRGGLCIHAAGVVAGTRLRVANADGGRSVAVIIDGRGPSLTGGAFALCESAFERIAPLGRRLVRVSVRW